MSCGLHTSRAAGCAACNAQATNAARAAHKRQLLDRAIMELLRMVATAPLGHAQRKEQKALKSLLEELETA